MSVDVHAAPIPRGQRNGRAPATTADARPSSSRFRALDALWILALLGLLGVVLPVIVTARYGAIGIPRSDDWSYLLTLFRWVDSGELSFNGWVSMTLVGQVAMAAPVAAITGRSITSIQIFTALIGLVGLLGVVFIGREVVRPAWWPVFVAATIAVGPLWGPLAPTFMTDIPTFTFAMLTISAAAVAFRHRPLSLSWFTLSIAVGFIGVSIRQYAVIPVFAIALVAVCVLVADRDWKKLRVVAVIFAVFAVAVAAMLYWWSGLPDSKSLSPTFPTARLVRATFIRDAGFLRLAGLLLFPVVVLAGPVTIVRNAWRASRLLMSVLTAGMAAWLVATYVRVPSTPFVGSYIARDGVLSDVVLSGDRPDLFPRTFFNLLVVLGSLAGMLIVIAAVPFLADLPRRVRAREVLKVDNPLVAVMGLTVVGFAAAYSVAVVAGLPVYDRYALPVLPLIALLVLRARQPEAARVATSRSRYAFAGIAVALLAAIGLAYTVESASFDGARWKVAERVAEQGFDPKVVGGGFEWLGYHREQGPMYGPEYAKQNGGDALRYAPPCVSVIVGGKSRKAPSLASAESRAISRRSVTISAYRNLQPCIEDPQPSP